MSQDPGIKPVILFVNGEPVSTLNPLPATDRVYRRLQCHHDHDAKHLLPTRRYVRVG